MEVELNKRKLRVYKDGKIESFLRNKYWKEVVLKPTKTGRGQPYYCIRCGDKRYKVHRIVGHCYLGLDITDKKALIDHINHDTLNNNVENLRIVSNQQNQFNLSNAKGYYWDKRANKWVATIGLNKKTINLGRYDTEEEAREAYLRAKKIYHII